MTSTLRYTLLTLLISLASATQALAQCSMCRATLENNAVNGETTVSAYVNMGIMYLFVLPYLAVGLVAFLWYRRSKKNAAKNKARRHFWRKVSSMQDR